MGVFESSKLIPHTVPDLEPVAEAVVQHFESQGFEVAKEPLLGDGWVVDLAKGNLIKHLLGMKTALKIKIERKGQVTSVRASVGLFKYQALPTAIMILVFYPIAATQIWGLIQQAKLDDEAIDVVASVLQAMSGGAGTPGPAAQCPVCGTPRLTGESVKFCRECGADFAKLDAELAAARAPSGGGKS